MGLITDIQEQKRRNDRLSVFIDGEYAFSMDRMLLVKTGIYVGQELSLEDQRKLGSEATLEDALNAGAYFLGFRPRSEREVRCRLRQRGFDYETVGKTVDKLKEQGLLNDQTFAQYWKENRESFNPRSKRMLVRELMLKGVDREIVEEVSADVDDGGEAYRTGLKKARSLPQNDHQIFYKKMMTFLRGRGFDYTTSSETAKRLWNEIKEENPSFGW